MNYDYEQTAFSKSILAGLITGIIALIASLLYNFIYRSVTSFSVSQIINVSSTIFGSLILCLLASLIFYFIVSYLKKKVTLYTILFLVVSVALVIVGFSIHRSADPIISKQFKGLYFGDVIIIGICCTFLIPWFARLKKSFFIEEQLQF